MFKSLSGVIERQRILAEAQGHVLLAMRRVELMKQTYDSGKSSLQEGIYNENKPNGDMVQWRVQFWQSNSYCFYPLMLVSCVHVSSIIN